MSESTPETPVETTDQAQAAEPKIFTEDYVKELRAEAAKYRTEAKNAKAEIDKVRVASLSEAEKAVLEAEERGRMSAVTAYGQRLAQTEFRAAAAARNPGYDVGKALKYVNLSGLLGEDGEPDTKAIAAAVADLVPEVSGSTPPSFDGGTRQPASGGADFNQLIRQATGRA